MVLISKKIY